MTAVEGPLFEIHSLLLTYHQIKGLSNTKHATVLLEEAQINIMTS